MIALKILTITFVTVYTVLAVDMARTIVKHDKTQIESDSINYDLHQTLNIK